MVALHATGSDDGGGVLGQSVCQKKLELPDLVAGCRSASLVVTFDVEGEGGGERGHREGERPRLDWCRPHCEVQNVRGSGGGNSIRKGGRRVGNGFLRHAENEGRGDAAHGGSDGEEMDAKEEEVGDNCGEEKTKSLNRQGLGKATR